MANLHSFYRVFPLFLLLMLLSGCAGNTAWDEAAGAQTPAAETPNADASVYTPSVTPMPGEVPPVQAAGGRAVKVALLLPLSGANAALGQSMLQAAQLAVFDQGYDHLELVPKDTAMGAGAAATEAVMDGAKLILGPVFANDVRAVKSATAGRGVNVIAFSTDWTLAGGNTYMMGFLPFGQVERVLDYAASHGVKSVAIASNPDQYGTATSRTFEDRARQKGLILTAALSDPSGYDGVFMPAGADALAGLLPRVADKDARKLGTGLWDDPRVAALPDMNGAWYAAPSPRARSGFESRYQTTYGAKPERLATLAYDATALAVTLAKTNAPAPFSQAQLTNPNGFAGTDGILRFSKSGLAERGLAVMEIKNGQATEIDPAPTTFQR